MLCGADPYRQICCCCQQVSPTDSATSKQQNWMGKIEAVVGVLGLFFLLTCLFVLPVYYLWSFHVLDSSHSHCFLFNSYRETNLKVRQALPVTSELGADILQLAEFDGKLYLLDFSLWIQKNYN